MTREPLPTIGLNADGSGDIFDRLDRIASALERLTPKTAVAPDFDQADAFVWQADAQPHLGPNAGRETGGQGFVAVPKVNRVALALLCGVEHTRDQLLANTHRFAAGLPANNALLWGARGMGKSSLVKAVHAAVAGEMDRAGPHLKLIEIHREDIDTLPRCLHYFRASPHRFIVFCDDLSFDHDDTSYKSLKAVLEGGIEGRPDNVLFYATSNRRHLMPRDMIENERSTAINPAEAVEEKVSLSDRFGLWLGFHNCSQPQYLEMVRGYAAHYELAIAPQDLVAQAIEWQMTRGARSGRVAFQFIQDLAGRMGKRLA